MPGAWLNSDCWFLNLSQVSRALRADKLSFALCHVYTSKTQKNVARGYLMEGFVAQQCGRKQTPTTLVHGLNVNMLDCDTNLRGLIIHIAQGKVCCWNFQPFPMYMYTS
jgi:hypothetical protein